MTINQPTTHSTNPTSHHLLNMPIRPITKTSIIITSIIIKIKKIIITMMKVYGIPMIRTVSKMRVITIIIVRGSKVIITVTTTKVRRKIEKGNNHARLLVAF